MLKLGYNKNNNNVYKYYIFINNYANKIEINLIKILAMK